MHFKFSQPVLLTCQSFRWIRVFPQDAVQINHKDYFSVLNRAVGSIHLVATGFNPLIKESHTFTDVPYLPAGLGRDTLHIYKGITD